MAYKTNPFLSDKDRKKKSNQESTVWSEIIDQKVKDDYYGSLEGSTGQNEREVQTWKEINSLPPSPSMAKFNTSSGNDSLPKLPTKETKDNFLSDSYLNSLKDYQKYMNNKRDNLPKTVNKVWNNTLDPVIYGFEKAKEGIPFLDRLMQSSGESFAGKGSVKDWEGNTVEKRDSGKIGNFLADAGGTVLGMKSLNIGSTNLLDATDEWGVKAGQKVANALGNKANTVGGKVLSSMARGAVDNGVGDTMMSMANTLNPIENAKEGLQGALGGATLFGVGKGASELLNATKGINIPKMPTKDAITKVIPKSDSINNEIITMPIERSFEDYGVGAELFNKKPNKKASRRIDGEFTFIPNPPSKVEQLDLPQASDLLTKVDEVATDGVKPTLDLPKQATSEVNISSKVNTPIETKVENKGNSNGVMAESKMKTNTYKNSPFMADEKIQKIVDETDGMYGVKNNVDTIARAKTMVETDLQGTIDRIKGNGIKSAEDSAASGIITNQLIKESQETGDTTALRDWLKTVRSEATNLGQAVQAISTWKKMSPEGMLLNAQRVVDGVNKEIADTNPKLFDKLEKEGKLPELTDSDVKFITEKMNVVDNLNNLDVNTTNVDEVVNGLDIPKDITSKWDKMKPQQKVDRARDIEMARVMQLIADKTPSATREKILAFQRINLLGNSKTQVRNILGNSILSALESTKDTLVASPIDMITSKITGNPRTTSYSNPLDKLEGMGKGLRESIEDFKLNIDTSKMSGRFGDKTTAEMPRTQAFRRIEKPKGFKDRLNNVMAGSEKLTNAALAMGDRPFFEGAFNDSLKQQMRSNKVTEPTEDMIKQALEVADTQTFQNVSNMAKGFRKLKEGLNHFGHLGDIVIPFDKTPGNISSIAVDYSPIGIVQSVISGVKAKKTGVFNQKEFVDQLSRGLTGAGLIYAGYELAKNKILQGQGAEDKDARALEIQSGKMPYSIKVGNNYNTIDWAQPAAIPLMIGADIAGNGADLKTLDSIVLSAVQSGGSTLFNQSLLTGISDLFGGYGNNAGENIMKGATNAYISALEQAVPFGSALGQITKLTDNNVRNTTSDNQLTSTLNRITSKLPSLPGLNTGSESLPKKYDTVGQEVKQNNGSTGLQYFFDTFINPGKTTTYNPTPTEKLALDLYDRTGSLPQIPQVVGKKVNYETNKGKGSMNLNNRDQSELQKLMGEKTEDAFQNFMKTNRENLTDEVLVDRLEKLIKEKKKEAEKEFLKTKGISVK